MPPAGTKTTLAKARLSQANAPREQPVSGLAYEKLLEFILSGELAPGTVLNERRLALELEISRTPVREAISRLAAEGLITSQDNRSPAVSRIPVQKFIEILKTRKLLEVEAAGIAAQNRLPISVAQRTRDAIEQLLQRPTPTAAEHWAVDDLVHGAISDAAQSRLLANTILDLRRRTRIFSTERIPSRLKPGAAEHLAIINAAASGDVAVAQERMAEHIDNVRAAIVERILSIGTSE
jgi:DNA-binding GntR family transcriptional regulator